MELDLKGIGDFVAQVGVVGALALGFAWATYRYVQRLLEQQEAREKDLNARVTALEIYVRETLVELVSDTRGVLGDATEALKANTLMMEKLNESIERNGRHA